jgi:transposase
VTRQQALVALAEKDEALAHKDGQIEELTRTIETLRTRQQQMEHQMDQLLKRLYGKRSEKWDPSQGVFDEIVIRAMEEGATQPPARGPEPTQACAKVGRAGRTHRGRPHGRLVIPDHLERVEVPLDVPEDKRICPATGKPMICIGYEVSEKLEFEPGRLYVRVYKRPKYVSPQRHNERDTGILTAPMPEHPIARCKADLGLLAWIVISKYADHLPLYRQETIFGREGLSIPRSTQDGWLLQVADAINPLYDVLKAATLDSGVIFTDDSVIPLLEPGLGRTRQARLWVYIRGGPGPRLVIYDFTEDRRKARPLEFLANYQGFVHADAYSGYDELFRRKSIVEVGCWAHGRRGFVEAMDSRPREASEILARIGQLYEIEAEIRGGNPESRRLARQEKAVPKIGVLMDRVAILAQDATPAEPLRKALGYVLNQREALMRYAGDGRLEIDNNTAENAMRPLALGRKNWLFAGSPRGGRATALYLSLVESCRQNDVNPWSYLRDLFGRIMSHPVHRLRELLPDRWHPRSAPSRV